MTGGVIHPGSTIGIVGGGQLGRMLVLEARRMGYRTAVLDPGAGAPAAQVADLHVPSALDDPEGLRRLADAADVLTLEWENADPDALASLGRGTPVHPGPEVLRVSRNRVREKDRATALGLETAPYRPVRSAADLSRALREVGTPAILKTAEGGYDGRGQARIAAPEEADRAFHAVGGGRRPLILEGMVSFQAELSVVFARSAAGEDAAFPVVRNVHQNGILDTTVAPSGAPSAVEAEAVDIARTIARGLSIVGVFAVELFWMHDDRLLVNEMAPRPHNSGHLTWEACPVSQFEQQLRAVCGLPLGDTTLHRPTAMANLLGRHFTEGAARGWPRTAYPTPAVSLHLYGKSELRPDRKMGHLTAFGRDADDALRTVMQARDSLRSG